MSLPRKKIVGALEKKGFGEDRAGSDHKWFRFYIDDKKTPILTKVSHGSRKYRELGDDLVQKMARQIKLTVPQFREFVNCDLSEDGYIALLRKQGELED